MKRSSSITIHQALHGYNDGHRLLSGSKASLVSKDQRTMLVMSDASGPLEEDGGGYITGYPLETSGVYALARTWSASELPRPGCVWTHTLIIEFADLAAIHNLWRLKSLFAKPDSGKWEAYSDPLKMSVDTQFVAVPRLKEEFAEQLIRGIYSTQKSSILPGAPLDDSMELLVLQAWSQQWPRLRRRFSFCTHAASNTSDVQTSFDLQFVSTTSALFRTSLEGESHSSWVNTAAEDLYRPSSLRTFLREIALDLHGIGKEAFPDLVEIYSLLGNAENARAFERAVEIADRRLLKSDGGEKLRLSLLRLCLQGLGGDSGLNTRVSFLRNNSRRLTPDLLAQVSDEDAAILWNAIPDELSSWLTDSDQARQIAAFNLIRGVRSEQIVDALPHLGESTTNLISARPDVLVSAEVWSRASGPIRGQLLDLVPPEWSHWPETISAMIEGGASDIATQARDAAGSDQFVVSVLGHLSNNSSLRFARTDFQWLQAAVVDRNAVSRYLGSERPKDIRQLYALSQFIAPDEVPNSFGHDPWLEALQGVSDSPDSHEYQYLSAYLLARALGYQSRSRGELIASTLDVVYRAAARNQISHDSWSVLDPRLPNSTFWFAWDRCRRIREGVVDVFVRCSLGHDLFAQVTGDDNLFDDLVRLVSEQRAGRRYLKGVLQVLRRQPKMNQHRVSAVQGYV